MIDNGRLSVVIDHVDGRISRWGYDELDGRDIPNDLTFSTSVPGGFQDMTCSLFRRIDQDHPDLGLFDTVTVYGAGNRIAWQGRMHQFPRSHGASQTITPGAVGWSSALRDNSSFQMIYIDRDLTRWGTMPADRRIALVNAGWGVHDPSIGSNGSTAGPSVVTSLTGAWGVKSICEAWYDAGPGNNIGAVYYGWTRGTNVNNADANWAWDIVTTDGEAGASTAFTANLRAAGPASGSLTAGASSRWAYLQHLYGVAAGVSASNYDLFWSGQGTLGSTLKVIGDHGLKFRVVTGELDGYYASDIIADIVSRAAPSLTYTTGTGGSIEPTSFAIPHAVFRDPTTGEDAVSTINAHHLYDWGVYDNLEFFYRQPDPGRLTWEARLGDGAYMDADGLTGEQVINGVVVTYQDGAGVTRTVGPPSGSFETTSALLEDTSTTNPATAAGLSRWANLQLSFPTIAESAIVIGAAYLTERATATRRGSMTLSGTIQHPTEGKVPVWRVRAGDWIRVSDLNGDNADVPRKVISTTYSHQSRSVSLSLDNTVAKLDAILARVGVQTGITMGGGF